MVTLIGLTWSAMGKEAQVEIKYMVPGGKIAEAIKNLHIDAMRPNATRVVCYYDTASRNLFNHKPQIILRARYSTGGKPEADVTVKIREATAGVFGARREFDQVVGRVMVESWSLTKKQRSLVAIKAANHGIGIKMLFDKDQVKFVRETRSTLDWDQLIAFGPVSGVKTWNLTSIAGLRSITVEQWELPTVAGKAKCILFEVSTRVPAGSVVTATKALGTAIGFELVATQDEETKTKLVLEHFSNPTDRRAIKRDSEMH